MPANTQQNPAPGKSCAIWRWLFGGILLATLLLLPSGVINQGDGGDRYLQVKAMLDHGRLWITPDDYQVPGERPASLVQGAGGRYYIKYGVGLSLLWLIPGALAKAIHAVRGTDMYLVSGALISGVNPILTVATAISLLIIARRMKAARGTGLLLGTLYLLGTSALPYANTAFSEPLCNLLFLWAFALPLISETAGATIVSGLLLCYAVLVKNELILVAGPLLLANGGHKSLRRAMIFGSVVMISVVLTLVLNDVQRGGPLRFSYGGETQRFGEPWTAIQAYFFGIDKNILLFNPALLPALVGWIVCLRRGGKWAAAALAMAGLWGIYLLFYGAWWAWDGGLCFGPRFFGQFTAPTLLSIVYLRGEATISPLARKLLGGVAVAACLLGAFVNLPGAMVKPEQAYLIAHDPAVEQHEVWIYHRLLALKLERGMVHAEVYQASDFRHDAGPEELDFRNKRTFQYLNHWWSIYLANKLRAKHGLLKPPTPQNVMGVIST